MRRPPAQHVQPEPGQEPKSARSHPGPHAIASRHFPLSTGPLPQTGCLPAFLHLQSGVLPAPFMCMPCLHGALAVGGMVHPVAITPRCCCGDPGTLPVQSTELAPLLVLIAGTPIAGKPVKSK